MKKCRSRGEREHWYVDIETRDWTKFELAAAHNPRTQETIFFTSLDMLYDFVRDANAVLWAHNGGGFDWKFIVGPSIERGDFRGARVVGGRYYELRVGSSICRDTLYLLKGSLAELAPKFGLEKLKIDYGKISRSDTKTWEYLENDCVILGKIHRAVTDYLGFDRPPGTIGGAAVKLWLDGRKPPYSQDYKNMGRRCYYGGRTEIFKLSGSEINAYDVNSLYPYIMSRDKFPVGPYSLSRKIGPKTACARVKLRIPDCHIPPAPMLLDRLYFPVGEFTADLARPELDLCEPWIERVQWAVDSEDWARIFKDWILARWAKRKAAQDAGDAGGALFEKLLMNNLSGKLCEDERKTRVIATDEIVEGDRLLDEDFDLVERSYWAVVPHSQPIVGCQITSAARVELYHWLTDAASRGELYYTATDSIHCEAQLVTGRELGELKCEGQKLPGRYVQCGVYQYGARAKIRGYRSLPDNKLSPIAKAADTFRRLTDKGEAELDTFSGAMTVLTSREFKLTRAAKKKLTSMYNKRRVIYGGNTIPWTADELRRGAHLPHRFREAKEESLRDLIVREILDMGGMRPYKGKGGHEPEREENLPLKRRGLMHKRGAETLDVMTEMINSRFNKDFSADELREYLCKK